VSKEREEKQAALSLDIGLGRWILDIENGNHETAEP